MTCRNRSPVRTGSFYRCAMAWVRFRSVGALLMKKILIKLYHSTWKRNKQGVKKDEIPTHDSSSGKGKEFKYLSRPSHTKCVCLSHTPGYNAAASTHCM